MLSRIEFYLSIGAICGLLIYSLYSNDVSSLDMEKAKLQARDSMLTNSRDSAISRSLALEIMGDSLNSVINRKKLDIELIKKKHEKQKNIVRSLDADSSLSMFIRATAH